MYNFGLIVQIPLLYHLLQGNQCYIIQQDSLGNVADIDQYTKTHCQPNSSDHNN